MNRGCTVALVFVVTAGVVGYILLRTVFKALGPGEEPDRYPYCRSSIALQVTNSTSELPPVVERITNHLAKLGFSIVPDDIADRAVRWDCRGSFRDIPDLTVSMLWLGQISRKLNDRAPSRLEISIDGSSRARVWNLEPQMHVFQKSIIDPLVEGRQPTSELDAEIGPRKKEVRKH
jgi:hypothetical protein